MLCMNCLTTKIPHNMHVTWQAVLHHVYVTILFSRITDSTLSPDDYNLELLPVEDTKRWQEMANVSTLRIGVWSAIHL